MTPGSFVFLLDSSDDHPSNQPRIHLGMCLKVHFQRGLDEEGMPPLNVSKLIPWTGASDWTKSQKEENMDWTLAFFSLLPKYGCTGTSPSHFCHYAFLSASFLKVWAPMTPSPQMPSVWYFLITMRWVTNAVTFQIISKNAVVKGQLVNVLGFLDRRVPVTATQLSHQSSCKRNLRTGSGCTHYNFLYGNMHWQEFDEGADTCSTACVGEKWINEQSVWEELSKQSSPLWLDFLCKNLLPRVLMRTNQIVTRVSRPQLILHSGPQGFIAFPQDQPPSLFSWDWFSDTMSQRKEWVSESDKYYTGKTSRKEEVEGESKPCR